MSWQTKDIQRLLSAAGYYNGGIDGMLGAKSFVAIDRIIASHAKDCVSNPDKWSSNRRTVAAAQLVLKYAGYEPGAIDGYWGNNTEEALRAFDYERATGKREEVIRAPTTGYVPVRGAFPTQAGCTTFYGSPGSPALIAQLEMYTLPVAMRLDWNLGTKSTKVQLHKKCGTSAMSAMEEIVRHYGEKRWRELGLDRNAGTYNNRKMRGGTSWSMHAYGCAWDFWAEPNGLRVRCPQAKFCGSDYKAFFDIWEAHGWTSLGRAIGRDWMHVQAASL